MTFTRLRVLLALLACALPAAALSAAPAEVSVGRQRELLTLLRHDCGSCHGMRLTGGLGPALTPQALAGKSPQLLADSIIDGRPGTAMPPWQGLLDRAETLWIVARLLNGVEQ